MKELVVARRNIDGKWWVGYSADHVDGRFFEPIKPFASKDEAEAYLRDHEQTDADREAAAKVCGHYAPTSRTDLSCYTCGGTRDQHDARDAAAADRDLRDNATLRRGHGRAIAGLQCIADRSTEQHIAVFAMDVRDAIIADESISPALAALAATAPRTASGPGTAGEGE